jgi:ankyrin repeat protein
MLQLLLDRGANVDQQDANGNIPLMLSTCLPQNWDQCKDVMRLLLLNNANLWLKNNNGETALSYAISQGAFDSAFFFVK